MPTEVILEQLVAAASKPRPAFVGILRRGWAFLLDIMLIYLIGHELERAARPALLNLNPWLPWLGFVISFAYFWLANGPVGRGRTFGKLIMHIAVVDHDGRPLEATAALRRAVIQQFGLLIFLGISNFLFPDYHTSILPVALRYPVQLVFLTLVPIALSWLAALIVSAGVHPYKRGWHDEWAGSYVTFSPTPNAFIAHFGETPDAMTQGRLNKQRMVTLGFWVLAMLALMVYPLRLITSPQQQENHRQLSELASKVQLPGFTIKQFYVPDPAQIEMAMLGVQMTRAQQAGQVEHEQQTGTAATTGTQKTIVETTDTILSRMPLDGHTILVLAFQPHGAIDPQEITAPAMRAQVAHLQQVLWADYQQQKAPEKGTKLEARQFKVMFFEPFQFLFNNNNLLLGSVMGPADPAAGGLQFKVLKPGEEPPSAPTASTTATTATTEIHARDTHTTATAATSGTLARP